MESMAISGQSTLRRCEIPEYHHSRAGEVVKSLIGEKYQGVLGSDFYAGYNTHQGLHQRCWVHFLDDMHESAKAPPS
jgi:Transposase IS66 family